MGQTNFDKISAKDASGLKKLNASELTSGTVPLARLAGITPAQLSQPNAQETITLFVAGALAVAQKVAAALVGVAGTIVDVRAYADTAPVGATLIIDVNKNGVTVFTTQANRPTVADGAKASTTTPPDVTAVAAGDRLTVDVDQVGSGTPGSDLYVAITVKRSPVA